MAVPLFLQRQGLQDQGFFDANGNPRAPSLTLDDLYQGGQVPDLPAAPQYIGGVGELSEEDRKRLRMKAILQAAMAFGAPGGQIGTALGQAAQQTDTDFQGAVDAQNAQADAQYQNEQKRYVFQRQRAQDLATQGQQKLDEQNRLKTYQQISQQDPELATEAEGAARSGDDKRLQALLEAIPRRKAEVGMGYDANDPFVEEKVKAGLAADADARKRKAMLETLPQELKIKNQAELDMLPQKLSLEKGADFAERQRLNAAGLLWNPRGENGGRNWEPKIVVRNGRLTMADLNQIDPKTGQPKMVDLGPAGHTGKPILRTVVNSMGERETWQIDQDPETGQWGEMHPTAMSQQVGGQKQPTRKESGIVDSIKNFFSGSDKTASPAAPAPKATGQPANPQKPSPMLDQPQGAPAAGRGQGPARSPLRGKAAAPAQGPTDPVETSVKSIEAQVGKPLPPKVRAALKARLASGSDAQTELQHILSSMPGGR